MQKRKFTYWPFKIDECDDRGNEIYGPINDETIAEVIVDFGSPELLDHAHLIPAPPEGCFYGCVGIETVEVED